MLLSVKVQCTMEHYYKLTFFIDIKFSAPLFLQFVEGRTGATDMLNKFDFYIIPVMNPDGYAYTWSNVSIIRSYLIQTCL